MSLAAAKSRGRRWSRLWQWSECREGLLTRAGGKGKKQLDSGEAREREELDGTQVSSTKDRENSDTMRKIGSWDGGLPVGRF